MTGATRQVEITVRTITQPLTLGRLMAITASRGADVLAACSYSDGGATVVKLVTENAHRTMRALRAAGFDCLAQGVVMVEAPNKPGLAALLKQKLTAAGIGVLRSYWFRSGSNQSYTVFKTTDDEQALYLLEVDALIHDLAAAKSWRPSEEIAEQPYHEEQAA